MAIERLGEGPFQIIEVLEPDCSYFASEPRPWDAINLDRCACCGKKISWRVILEGPNGFYCVGRTCARTATSLDTYRIEKLAKAAQNKAIQNKVWHEPFRTWLSAQPHPKGWRNKTRLDDVVYWALTRKRVSVLNKAWNTFIQPGGKVTAELRAPIEEVQVPYVVENVTVMTDFDSFDGIEKMKAAKFQCGRVIVQLTVRQGRRSANASWTADYIRYNVANKTTWDKIIKQGHAVKRFTMRDLNGNEMPASIAGLIGMAIAHGAQQLSQRRRRRR